MSKEDKSRPVSSYSLLKMKMNEVQKSKKPNVTQNSNSVVKRGNQNSSNFSKSSLPPRRTLNKDEMSPPKVNEPSSGKKEIVDPDVPDRSYGDYFCALCDSHMNSDGMWEAHIIGKRHIKNVNKGNPDSKYEDLDVESSVMHEIRNIKDPIIGLSYIHEARRKDVGAPPMYTCFLCQATCATVPLVIEHVLTMKHRMNFIKENSPDDYQLLEATNLKKGLLESLVAEVASKLETKFGRGTVKVKQEKVKQTPVTYSAKRMLDSDDDDVSRKSQKSERKNPYSWKSTDYSKENVKEKDRYIKDTDKRQRNSLDENFDEYKRHDLKIMYDSHSNKYESSASTSRDLYEKESYYPRKSVSPERYYHPRSPPHESLKDTHASKLPYGPKPIPRYSRSRSPPRESLKDTYSSKMSYGPEPISKYPRSRSPPRHAYGPDPVPTYSSSRSHDERPSRSSENYSSAENTAENAEPHVLKDFVQKIYSLQPEIFLKIVLLKLENLEVKGIEELSLLSKVINKAQAVLCNKLPPDVQAVIKQRMSQTSENVPRSSSIPPVPQISESMSSFTFPTSHNRPLGSQSQSDLSFIKEFLDHRKAASSSVIQNISSPHQAPPQSAMSYQNQPYGNSSYQNNAVPSYPNTNVATSNTNPYNNAPSKSSGIPGLTLTEENRQSYNSYQTPYTAVINPDQSSNYPPPYGY